VLLVRTRAPEPGPLWGLPAGKVEPGETSEQAAVRETLEETGLTVRAVTTLGERIHPATSVHMTYVACEVVAGAAHVAATDELAEVEWCDRTRVGELVPGSFFAPVQRYLDAALSCSEK
jgi:8-oxo-dGTP diphosphatase